jgi:CubicO group peptidase (beta-lactamase class C family)
VRVRAGDEDGARDRGAWWARVVITAVTSAMVALLVVAPPTRSAQAEDDPEGSPATDHLTDVIIRAIEDHDSEPMVGTPPVTDLGEGRLRVITTPEYWFNYTHEALSGRLILPTPIDLVRPEWYLPTMHIAPGDHTSALPYEHVDLLDVTYEWDGRTKTLEDFLDTTETDGVAFAHGGVLIDEHYRNGWSPEIRHQVWSVTKSFTSALVGIAIDQGLIASLDDPIETYIDELRDADYAGASIRDLLRMESGIFWDESTPVLVENTQVRQWVEMAVDLYTDGQAGMTRNEFLASLERVDPPGTVFRYNSGDTQVLAWLVETVFDRPFNEVISTELWQPAGMATDARILVDRQEDAIASQSLYARMHDLVRFGELYRNLGVTPEGQRVVSEQWVRDSVTFSENSDGQYGYQWWRGATDDGYMASGFQGNKITVSPETCLVGVRISHQLGADLAPDGDVDDPEAWGFDVEMGGEEWDTLFRAVVDELGAECPAPEGGGAGDDGPGDGDDTRDRDRDGARSGDGDLPAAAPEEGQDDGRGGTGAGSSASRAATLPATGGGAPLLAPLALLLGFGLRRSG